MPVSLSSLASVVVGRSAVAETPPETKADVFGRSPEEVARDRERNEREIEAEKAKAAARAARAAEEAAKEAAKESEPKRPNNVAPEKLLVMVNPFLAETTVFAEAAFREREVTRRALPCIQALFGENIPDNYTSMIVRNERLHEARKACDDAGAAATCEFSTSSTFCAHRAQERFYEQIVVHMRDADILKAEKDVVMAIARRAPTVIETDALRIVRQWLRETPGTVRCYNADAAPTAAQFRSNAAERFVETRGEIHCNGKERLVVLGGNNGRGKSVAAAYAIARRSGRYVTHASLANLRGDALAELKRNRGVVVVDQFGRAPDGDRKQALLAAEDLVHDRYSDGLDTMLIGNVDVNSFITAADKVVADRAFGELGLVVIFAGPSLRRGL